MRYKVNLEMDPNHQLIVDNVNDILIELIDEGFNVDVGSCVIFGDGSIYVDKPFDLDKKGLIVEISKGSKKIRNFDKYDTFKYSKISEYILTVIDFMKEEWMYIEPIYIYDTDILEKSNGIPKQNKEIQSFRLIIKKKKPTMLQRFVKKFEDITEISDRPTDKAIIDSVKDILVELVDDGFEPEVGVAEYDDNFGGGIFASSYCVDLDKKGLVVDINMKKNMMSNYFEYSEISEYILTVIDFMKLNWEYIEVVYLYNLDSGYQRYKIPPKQDQKLQRFTLLINKTKPTMFKKFLKNFEAFSMHVDICPRCGESTNNQTTMSVFNTDVICIPCKEKEKEDPDYQLAVDTEVDEVRKGNHNYPGIYPNYKPLD